MGYLFENMEKMDIQAERRKTAEAEKKLEGAQKELEEERRRAEAAENKLRIAEEIIRRMNG